MTRKLIAFIVLFAACIALCVAAPAHAERLLPREYRIKAAFLYNFAKFIEWPADAFADDNAPMTLCVLGDASLEEAFGLVEGKSVKGRKLKVLHLKTLNAKQACHIIFISSSENDRVAKILPRMKNQNSLTVGEAEEFIGQGGMINFVVKQNKIRFDIHIKPAKQAGLTISSKLLKLAITVK